jgi:endoglucanase
MHMTSSRRVLLALVSTLALVVAVLVLVATRGGDSATPPPPAGAASTGAQPVGETRTDAATAFLHRYVEDGRVVRTDQGGDTVSEGQAYAMLLAAATGDEATFRSVWGWTQQHLRRDDGLLSWHWDDGKVVDATSASDADLDAARALVVAGDEFADASLTRQGVDLGAAILDHETVATPYGRLLVAGSWATHAPYDVNPSYVAPRTFALLAKASGDQRWLGLSTGSRAAVQAATPDGELPPDWAEVAADGTAKPVSAPSGAPVQFGYDAARTFVRYAESCDADDRRYVRAAGADLADDEPAVASYDLDGSPRTDDRSPLSSVAQAAVLGVDGDTRGADAALAEAQSEAAESPTYYGDAWAALGSYLLDTDALGGCPVLGTSGS